MLQHHIKQMKELLEVPKKERNAKWGHDVCTESRFIHIDVWQSCPDRKIVVGEIIPLLKEAGKGLFELTSSNTIEETDRLEIEKYAHNDILRIKNLEENYAKGRMSAFVPDETLMSELIKKANVD